MTETIQTHGITYTKPKVTLLQDSGLGVAELSARTCYDSFDKSEHDCIVNKDLDNINDIPSSEILTNLAWVHHHHSIIEHATLSFLVEGTSRGVLQEHARHRIQSISVRSTRYTMSHILNAYVASMNSVHPLTFFINTILDLDMFVITDKGYNTLEIEAMFYKLEYQQKHVPLFTETIIAKSSIPYLSERLTAYELYTKLEDGKKKRNVGDMGKHLVTDNWKVDMVVTFNIRSLKNYFDLRDSGSAYFQIQWLAKEMKIATPLKYLKLIDKKYKELT